MYALRRQVADDLEVADVVSQQRDAMNVCDSSNDEINSAASTLSASGTDGSRQPAPLASDLVRDWKRVKCRLDHTQPGCSAATFACVDGYEHAAIKLGDRDNADCRFDIGRRFVPYEDGGIDKCTQQLCERICQRCREALEIPVERARGRGAPNRLQGSTPNPSPLSCWAQLRHRFVGNSDRDLLTGFGATQDLSDVIAEILLWDGRHTTMVVKLLPQTSRGQLGVRFHSFSSRNKKKSRALNTKGGLLPPPKTMARLDLFRLFQLPDRA